LKTLTNLPSVALVPPIKYNPFNPISILFGKYEFVYPVVTEAK